MRALGPVTYRLGREADMAACLGIWRAAVDNYQGRLNQPPMPEETGPLRRHLAHMLSTDPDRFWLAEVGREDGESAAGGEGSSPWLVGFALATVRDGLWYLAMLFVLPAVQGRGIGAALLDRAQAGRDAPAGGPGVPGPDNAFDSRIHTWGMATDTAQPISNGLYARRGMVPRLPMWRLAGEPVRWSALPALPTQVEAIPFDSIAANGHDGPRRLAEVVDGIDREVIGLTHQADHEFLRRDGRAGFLVRERSGRALGYAYGSTTGRIGPIAALDPDLLPSLLGVAIRQTPILGTVGVWVPGSADAAIRALLEAGLQFVRFPGLICWSRPEMPFARYLPINLARV
jgi:GNAT superfamily N-acetyltransferase